MCVRGVGTSVTCCMCSCPVLSSFEPLAVLGGLLWCTGNMMCVPIIQLVGIGLGMLVWGASNLVMGW